MIEIMRQKGKTATEISKLENTKGRAEKIGIPVALQFPERPVAVIFYNEDKPNNLYGALRMGGIGMDTLHKWNYGTNPDAGVIDGAENFEKVYAYPLPNDMKPVCAELTRKTGQEGVVDIIELRDNYISVAALGKSACLFPLNDRKLFIYGKDYQDTLSRGGRRCIGFDL
jgi:hypothetical protein